MAQASSILDVTKILKDYSIEVNDDVLTVAKDVANEYVGKIQDVSPVNQKNTKHKGRYKKGWKAQVTKEQNDINVVIYNKSDWQLTWLLENGHLLRNGNRTKPQVHIAPVNEDAQREFETELIKRLGG